MSALTTILQTTAISTSLLAAGGIATLSLFDVPLLQSQPASRSLPSIRWLFSRGSHIFPTAAFISAAGFSALAVRALPVPPSLLPRLLAGAGVREGLRLAARTSGYLAAGLLCISIAPWTTLVMIPNNFALIGMNADKGGSRSERSAGVLTASGTSAGREGARTAADSVDGKGEANQWADLSGPQGKTPRGSTAKEDGKAREMLGVFAQQNWVRAVLMACGGVVGILTALA